MTAIDSIVDRSMRFISSVQRTALTIFVLTYSLPPASGQLRDVLKAWEKIDARSPREVRFDLSEKLPDGGHLQGVQWIQRGAEEFLLLSGSGESFSYLATVDLSGKPPYAATLAKLLDSPYRHAGGFQVFDGRFVAVGLEDNQTKDRSKVWVLDASAADSLERPTPVIEIDRRGEIKRSTAGAIALGQIGERHLLIVGTWDSATLDFYESNGHPLNDSRCQFVKGETWSADLADRSDWSDNKFESYQNINLVTDENGQTFLAAFCREGDVDLMDLYELKMEEGSPTSQRLIKRTSKRFHCGKTSFRAGAGLRISKDGSLNVYSCSHRGDVIEWFK